MTNRLRFPSLNMETERLNRQSRRTEQLDAPRIVLRAATPAGNVREIELSRRDLTEILKSAGTIASRLVLEES